MSYMSKYNFTSTFPVGQTHSGTCHYSSNATKNTTEIMSKGCPSLPRVLLSPTDSTWTARLFWWELWGICSSLAGRAGAPKEWPPTAAIGLWEGFSICINLWGHRQSITTATQSQLSLCVRAHTLSHTYATLRSKCVNQQRRRLRLGKWTSSASLW